jgi:hypothetical protein
MTEIENRIYSTPPIQERIAGVYTDITQETFESLLPSWADKIASKYPRSEPVPNWEIDVETVDGVSIIKDAQPRAKIIHLFWQKHPKRQNVKGMRVRPDRLVFHLVREEDNSHKFSELISELEEWLGLWMEHFGVVSLKGVTLEYVNLLNEQITPQFVSPDGSLRIGEAFSLFTNIPGQRHTIIPPYDCILRLLVDSKMPCYFTVRLMNQPIPQIGVRIDFSVASLAQNKTISPQEALEELRFAHKVMLEQFDCFFTEKAKESFA